MDEEDIERYEKIYTDIIENELERFNKEYKGPKNMNLTISKHSEECLNIRRIT